MGSSVGSSISSSSRLQHKPHRLIPPHTQDTAPRPSGGVNSTRHQAPGTSVPLLWAQGGRRGGPEGPPEKRRWPLYFHPGSNVSVFLRLLDKDRGSLNFLATEIPNKAPLPPGRALVPAAPGQRPTSPLAAQTPSSTSSLSWRSISAPGVLLVPAFRDLGLWEGMGGSSISLFRQLQLSFSLGCGYFLHSFVCCPASQYLRDCGRVLEQIGALMAPAAAAPIAGCPCSRAAAAPPLVYLI